MQMRTYRNHQSTRRLGGVLGPVEYTEEARQYFGPATEPSTAELHEIADRYPVFRIDYQRTRPHVGS
jgi:hypothetical protein